MHPSVEVVKQLLVPARLQPCILDLFLQGEITGEDEGATILKSVRDDGHHDVDPTHVLQIMQCGGGAAHNISTTQVTDHLSPVPQREGARLSAKHCAQRCITCDR